MILLSNEPAIQEYINKPILFNPRAESEAGAGHKVYQLHSTAKFHPDFF